MLFSEDLKAMYLSEVARMYAQFEDTTTATMFYRLAGETALSGQLSDPDKAAKEVTEQTQILIASTHDRG